MRRAALARRLRHVQLRSGDRYLELGCGRGKTVMAAARDLGLVATGVDRDAGRVEIARARATSGPGARFVAADCVALPFGDCEFEIVAATHLLHHVPDWPRALSEIGRVLVDGGHLVLSDHVMSERSSRRAARVTGPRIRFLTRPELERAIADSGLEPVSVSRSRLSFKATYLRTRRTQAEDGP